MKSTASIRSYSFACACTAIALLAAYSSTPTTPQPVQAATQASAYSGTVNTTAFKTSEDYSSKNNVKLAALNLGFAGVFSGKNSASDNSDQSSEADGADTSNVQAATKPSTTGRRDTDKRDTETKTTTSTEETPKELHKKAQRRAASTEGDTPVMTKRDKREILWLARIIYSETKRPREQRLVAWVVRNRVDTGYTGQTYEAVANHSAQFSGLQPYDSRYQHNVSRYWASKGENWQTALEIAQEVYFAPESARPFSVTTRHFYSPVAVNKPAWARGRKAVRVVQGATHSQPRFAFYARVR